MNFFIIHFHVYKYAKMKIVRESEFTSYGSKYELYPYKWYNLSALVEKPAFYLRSFFVDSKSPMLETTSKSMQAIKWIISAIGFVSSVLGILSFFKDY